MDPRERMVRHDDLEIFNAALDGRQAAIWTMLPGILQSFNPAEQSATVQVSIKIGFRGPSGVLTPQALPLLIHCPVQFPSGGGVTLTFPLASGNEGMVHFACRCIDAWWQNGGVQSQMEFRMHDLSDGFFIPGVRSKPNVITNISTTTTQLRSDDGTTIFELDPTNKIMNFTAPGGFNFTGPTIFGGTVTANGKRIDDTHEHTDGGGVGNSGPVA